MHGATPIKGNKGTLARSKRPPALTHPFSRAVTAAVDAFATSGKMLDAALAYAARGIPVFPVTVKSKRPIPKRDVDPTGRYPDGIPGTGGHLKATTDEKQIRNWWTGKQYLIGVPTGPRSGIWVLDPDTQEDHDHDGIGAWLALLRQHGDVATREHRTATDGRHIIFAWNAARPVSSRGHQMPPGIDVKTNGYFVTAPGRRKGRDYVVARDVDPVEAPEWIRDLLPGRSRVPTASDVERRIKRRPIANAFTEAANSVVMPRSEWPKFASALKSIPNNDLGYDDWIAFILAVWASTGGHRDGYKMARRWSRQSSKFNTKENFYERWFNVIAGSPPTDTGPKKIYNAAIDAGWEWTRPAKAKAEAITTALSQLTLEDARAALRVQFERFVNYDNRVKNVYELFAEEVLGPRGHVFGHRVQTGIGKTSTMADVLKGSGKSALFTIPSHNLGEELLAKMRGNGHDVELYRGLMRPDRDNEGARMCLMPDKVDAAIKSGQSVQTTCCKSGKNVCPFFDACGYQRQLEKTPQIWIAPSNVLFHRQRVFRKVELVIADEGFIDRALIGVEGDPIRISLDAMMRDGDERQHLAWILSRLPDGMLKLSNLLQLEASLSGVRIAEWKRFKALSEELNLRPGAPLIMRVAEMRRRKKIAQQMTLSRRIVNVIDDIEHMIDREIDVSGRLELQTDANGTRFLKWRGLMTISKQYVAKNMLLMDATLPPQLLLKQVLPNVTVAKQVVVAPSPHVHRRRVSKAPTSATKLIHGDAVEGHRQETRRYILQRFMETGSQASLVIAQKPVADWLRKQKLPDAIGIEHLNNLAGLDKYGRVRLQILIGRTAPGAQAAEIIAATYSGAMPEATVEEIENGFSWYETAVERVPMRDGKKVSAKLGWHPDELCEAVRWQMVEGELLQADGRARPLNRDANSPLDIDHLFDELLPGIVLDENAKWRTPSRFIDTAASDGVMLVSPVNMVRLWPTIWSSKRTAIRDIAEGVPTLPGFTEIRYRPKVAKVKWQTGWFNLDRVPDPACWLAKRLGVPVEVTP